MSFPSKYGTLAIEGVELKFSVYPFARYTDRTAVLGVSFDKLIGGLLRCKADGDAGGLGETLVI